MALNVSLLETKLKQAFQAREWSQWGQDVANAIDEFVLNGSIITNVTGTVTPPPPMAPYQATGTGNYSGTNPKKGSMTTSGLSSLINTLSSRLYDRNLLWADVGQIIASAIDDYVKQISITTEVDGTLVGTGIGNAGCIDTSSTYGTLVSDLTQTFTSVAFARNWNDVASNFASSVKSYLLGATIQTTDNGTIPANSWTGSGVGSFN